MRSFLDYIRFKYIPCDVLVKEVKDRGGKNCFKMIPTCAGVPSAIGAQLHNDPRSCSPSIGTIITTIISDDITTIQTTDGQLKKDLFKLYSNCIPTAILIK